MKRLNLFVLLILFIFSLSGCKKTDEKIEEKIVGRWKLKQIDSSLFGSWGPDNLAYEFECTADGRYIEYSGRSIQWRLPCDANGTHDINCSTEYNVIQGHLEVLMSQNKILKIKITKANKNRIKLIEINAKGGESEWTYLKQD